MVQCTNPNCRHRDKRKLRPLVISLLPPTTQNNGSFLSSTNANANNLSTVDDTATMSNSNNTANYTRQEQIMRMFSSHPSLVAHFEPPTFSPGVPSRDLRNRVKFLEHCHNAGILPDVEWEGICRAVREQQQQQTHPTTTDAAEAGEDRVKNDDGDAASHDQEEGVVCSKQSASVDSKAEIGEISKVINPFRYLAVETLIPKTNDDDEVNSDINKTASTNKKKKKQWLQYETTSLIPISPHRRGSAEDIILPYSMEIWRKAKTLNRDRSVLACTLAHLRAMKTLVSSRENENDDSPLDDGNSGSSSTAEFDFILEDNIRAFLGMADDGAYPEEVVDMTSDSYSGWSCECANRIWDIIEASYASQSKCHMRYYGWLGSLANLAWIYGNHLPRSAFKDSIVQHEHVDAGGCVIFPYPTNEDFELDSITASSKSTKDVAELHNPSCDDQASSSVEACSTPQFNTPGGTAAVWGTFAYTVSPAAYHSFILRLQNDVGSLMWKGKKMRAYRAKPIDKILPRHVKSAYEPSAVHVPSKVAFVRGPMVSLLHPQWDAGFRSSTELQYRLSCGCKDTTSSIDHNSCIDVWNHVWLGREERGLVQRKKDGEQSGHEEQNQTTKEESVS